MKTKALLDAARAMEFLHASNILHRDFKPENLLVTSLEVNSPVVCKLSDFGTTKGANTLVKASMTKGMGTLLYKAPEVLKGTEEYDNKADVFSFGITMAFTADGKRPYHDFEFKSEWQFGDAVLKGRRPTVESDLPSDYLSLMQACWDGVPSKRPDFNTIVKVLTSLFDSL